MCPFRFVKFIHLLIYLFLKDILSLLIFILTSFYVASSTYFRTMFYGGLSESVRNEIEVSIEDIHPDTFWVLLRWLYGQKDAIPEPDKFSASAGREYYTTDYLTFLVDLLRTTDI